MTPYPAFKFYVFWKFETISVRTTSTSRGHPNEKIHIAPHIVTGTQPVPTDARHGFAGPSLFATSYHGNSTIKRAIIGASSNNQPLILSMTEDRSCGKKNLPNKSLTDRTIFNIETFVFPILFLDEARSIQSQDLV